MDLCSSSACLEVRRADIFAALAEAPVVVVERSCAVLVEVESAEYSVVVFEPGGRGESWARRARVAAERL